MENLKASNRKSLEVIFSFFSLCHFGAIFCNYVGKTICDYL